MKKAIISFLMCLLIEHVEAQFCNATVTNQGALTVTTTTQTTSSFGSGVRSYFTFAVENGCTYTFSTCGLTSVNTMLRIYNSTTVGSASLVTSNDDACSSTQSSVSFTATANGTFSVLITRSSCAAFNAGTNTQMTYVKTCPPPPASSVQDCPGAVQICNDASLSGDFDDIGNIADWFPSLGACMPAETNSNWYFFEAVATGTINMTLNPGAAQDFDFAIWNLPDCSSISSTMPIRCSWYAGDGTTGLGNGATDVSEDFAGPEANGWVAPLNVVAGQRYYMVIDQWLQATTNFTIDFSFSSSGLLNCTPLPVEFISLEAVCNENSILLKWLTLSESNSLNFKIASSKEGENWTEIETVEAANNSSSEIEYLLEIDPRKLIGNYLKLVQTDLDGTEHELKTIYVDCDLFESEIILYPNPTEDSFTVLLNASLQSQQTEFQIFNAYGKLVYTIEKPIRKGKNIIDFNDLPLEKGTYYLVIPELSFTMKAVKFHIL
jgi:hypothetical protein